ncbi:MAG: hypothetical protein KAJ29_04815 [Alphaproteobacteria bacterium]|nr:hypothetical protein [Alphaproteobacteria bacterium]
MRFANPHPPRRGAFLLIALFSCLQILFGFFLFTGNGQDSVLLPHTSVQVASYEKAAYFNTIEPASDHNPQKLSLSRNCDECSTFSYFNKYRKKVGENAAKKHVQEKQPQHPSPSISSSATRYNPVDHPVITDNSSFSASPLNHEK